MPSAKQIDFGFRVARIARRLRQAVSDSLGLAHSEADVTGYFRAAGFIDVGLHDFIPGSLGRVTGTKAG